MASIVNYNGGLKRIEFSLTPNGPRKMVRLGGVSMKAAGTWRDNIEAIIGDKLANRSHDAELSKWLGGLDESMLKRMRAVGLADGVGLAQTTLGEFMEKFFAMLAGKPATRIGYGNVRRNLEEHFGKAKLVRDITAADADGWRAWLVEHEEKSEDGKIRTARLATPTISRRVIAARTMWRKAIRWKLAAENPFSGVKAGQQVNEARKHFVSREIIDKLITEAPDTEWAVIIALARYAGIRIPSELFALRWADVDFDNGRMTIRSSKTEHHDGGASRACPLFTELRPHLERLFRESAAEGAVYVVTTHRLGAMNLRQEFGRIIRRAGLTAWPKLFHNLRASRESELMREYDLATVCKWIGNSPAVAAKHYATSVDLNADFRRAAGCASPSTRGADGQAQQNAQQSTAGSDEQGMTSDEPINEKAPENRGNVASCQASANADKAGGWAVQGSNL